MGSAASVREDMGWQDRHAPVGWWFAANSSDYISGGGVFPISFPPQDPFEARRLQTSEFDLSIWDFCSSLFCKLPSPSACIP